MFCVSEDWIDLLFSVFPLRHLDLNFESKTGADPENSARETKNCEEIRLEHRSIPTAPKNTRKTVTFKMV